MSLQLRLTLYFCILQGIGTAILSKKCDIASPCDYGNQSASVQSQVQKLNDWVSSDYVVDKFMAIAGTKNVPGTKKICPLPHMPTSIKRKPRSKATLKIFYQGCATYILLIDEVVKATAVEHKELASKMNSKIAMPMCDILCLAYTTLNSKKKTQKIAKKVTRKYRRFAIKDQNICQIFQPVNIVRSLKRYLQDAHPKLGEKTKVRRTKRMRRSKRKPKQPKSRKGHAKGAKRNRKRKTTGIRRQRRRS